MDKKDDKKPKPPPDPLKKSALPDLERYRLQEKMRDKAQLEMMNHAIREWTLVRSLAWSERMIAVIAAILFIVDKDRDFISGSGIGFVIVSLIFLGPIYGVMMFASLMGVYAILRRKRALPKKAAGFRRIIYPAYILWFPVLYVLSHYAMNGFYELAKAVPVWDKVKEMWFK